MSSSEINDDNIKTKIEEIDEFVSKLNPEEMNENFNNTIDHFKRSTVGKRIKNKHQRVIETQNGGGINVDDLPELDTEQLRDILHKIYNEQIDSK